MTMSSTQTYAQGQVLTADSLTKHVTEATPTQLTAACDANGQDITALDEAGFTDAAASATAAGRLRRNSTNLTWHDGTNAGRLFYAGGTDVPVADGGTALSSGTSGGILGFTGTTTLASSGALTANALVLGGGAGATPTPMGSLGTTTTVLHGNASGAPTFAAVSLTADVTGTLPVGNGGSGATSFTANGVLYGNTTGAIAVTGQGGTNTILTASAGAPAFSATPIVNTSVQIGVVSTTTGALKLAHASSANLTTIQAGNATEANTYIWPTDGGSANQALITDGATPTTTLSWGTAGTAGAAISGTPADNQVAVWVSATAIEGAGAAGLVYNGNTLYVGDNANASMTVGITLNQGENDDEILALKSSDVAHGLTSALVTTETDTFLSIRKASATLGGATIVVTSEVLNDAFRVLVGTGGGGDTTKSTAAIGLIDFYVTSHNESNALVDVNVNGNMFAVRRRTGSANVCAFIVDAEGDLHVDGSTSLTAFDGWDDVALVRAFDILRSPGQVIRSVWDEHVRYNRDDLVRAGILGSVAPEDERRGARPLVNVTQLQRLHNGAIWQLSTRLAAVTERLQVAERRLAALPAEA